MNSDSFASLPDMGRWRPKYLNPSAWIGHTPFAYWYAKTVQPKVFVELGTHYGVSFFAVCQAVREHGLKTKCYAVDSWEGDEHAGKYQGDVFKEVEAHWSENYPGFSELLRSYFDDAVNNFEDRSIDLLHIDGFHTYEAVKHDFETWFPKLTEDAVVMFHDTMETKEDFGVHRFWDELTKAHPWSFNFEHAHGLGVLSLSKSASPPHSIFDRDSDKTPIILSYLEVLGSQLETRSENEEIKTLLEQNKTDLKKQSAHLSETEKQITDYKKIVSERDAYIKTREEEISSLISQLNESKKITSRLQEHIERVEAHLNEVLTSASWRMTGPFRKVKRVLKG